MKFNLRDYEGALIDLDKAHRMEPTSSYILRCLDKPIEI